MVDNIRIRRSIISLIDKCFRDISEYDYFAARLLFKNELFHQFAWYAIQSLEKMIKAILLYNDISVKEYSHVPVELLKRAESSLPNFAPIVDDRCKQFIEHLEEAGSSRYFEKPWAISSAWLIHLDASIWFLRRYAFHMGFLSEAEDPRGIDRLSQYISYAQNPARLESPIRFQFFSNSPILRTLHYREKNEKHYSCLVWKNLYFGRRAKHSIMTKRYLRSANPPQFINRNISPQLLEWIREHVRMDNRVVSYLEEECN